MKVFAVLLLAALAAARPEPPAPGYSTTRQDFMAPAFDAPSSSYGPPSNEYSAPSSQYGAPAQSYSAPSSQYGAPAQSHSAPSSQYGAPAQSHSAPSTQYGAPSSQYGAPSSQYGAPAAAPVRSAAKVSSRLGGGRGSRRNGGPSSAYGAPAVTAAVFRASSPSSSYGAPAPSSSYGAPAPAAAYGAPAPVYGPPGYADARARLAQDDLAEPANYEFSYAVDDAYSGSNFGHQEDRQEESAKGEYRVLLPDGRTQIVEYEADEGGYRPQIRYEESQGPYPASQRSHGGPY